MNREQIIAAACDAGLMVIWDGKLGREDYHSIMGSVPSLERFYTIAFNAGSDELRQQLAEAQKKLEFAEACLAGDGALITGLKADLAERDAIANRTKDECAALCYEQNWLIHGEEMSALILATKEPE